MANLPQSLSMNVPFGVSASSIPTSSGTPPNKERKMASSEQLVLDLSNPDLRENALLELSKKRELFQDLAPLLWNSFGTIAALLQEIVSIYPVLSPPNLTPVQSNRVCNALALLQVVLVEFVTLLLRNQARGWIKGFSVGTLEVSHLQFADDTLLFSHFDRECITNLENSVQQFEDKAGLKINFQKSAVAGINLEEEEMQWLSGNGRFVVKELPFVYLGLPLGGNPNTIAFWDPVIDKILKRIAKWKNIMISRGGRLTLLHSILNSLPIYFFSVFKAPSSVTKAIDKILRSFFWKGADGMAGCHLVKWDCVTPPFSHGGLAFGGLKHKNKALLLKWLWRFPLESDHLWHKVIVGIHGQDSMGWCSNIKRKCNSRTPWKHIFNLKSILEDNCTFSVGRGNSILFWEQAWLGDCSLASRFPLLFHLSKLKNSPVSRFWNVELHSWVVEFRRNLKDEEIAEWIEFNTILEPTRLSNRTDIRMWKPDLINGFSSKSALRVLWKGVGESSNLDTTLVWKGNSPRKTKVFLWLVMKDGVNSNQKFQARSPWISLQPNWCSLCMHCSETTGHILFHCSFSQEIWFSFLKTFSMLWTFHQRHEDNTVALLGGARLLRKKQSRVLWDNGIRAILWNLWLERNRRIFDGKGRSWGEVWEACVLNASIWSANCNSFCNYNPSLIASNWKAFL